MIEFRNVNKTYDTGTEAVHNANFKIEKGEFALRFDGFEHVEDRSVRHFDGQPLPLLCMKRCGDAVCCKERHAAKQDPEAFPDVVKVFHKVF